MTCTCFVTVFLCSSPTLISYKMTVKIKKTLLTERRGRGIKRKAKKKTADSNTFLKNILFSY